MRNRHRPVDGENRSVGWRLKRFDSIGLSIRIVTDKKKKKIEHELDCPTWIQIPDFAYKTWGMEALYNIARAYHHLGLVTLAAAYYEKVLAIHEKDYAIPKLPNENPDGMDNQKKNYCDLGREAAHNLHLIYKTSGALDLARQKFGFRSRNNKHMANWTELPQDLLILIAKRVDFLEDFFRFSRVCRSWQSVAVEENFQGFEQLPWLMLAQEKEEETNHVLIVSAAEGNLIGKLMLPEAKGKQCFESLGWLITVSETGDMNLLDPLSRVQIPLPHISFPKTSNFLRIRKAALTSCPSPSSKDNYGLMVIYEGFKSLCFWKSGEKAWTKIETSGYFFMDITYYKGKFYSLSHEGTIFVCDVWGRDPTVASIVGQILTDIDHPGKHPYLVESEGELLIVVGEGNYYRADYGTKEFRVFKVDLKDLACAEELHSLGDNALFVGHNSSISVRASNFQGIRPNCIYYMVDYFYKGGSRFSDKDTGIYNMEDRSVAPCYIGGSFSHIWPPLRVKSYF
ncbi:hypothetical protein RHSIM_Rhsim02G0229800 [Rhododendron simsii]|uniref:F-box domain-containing protein n=1 Tax=Rhododendron simsii TaxID=118357 RepID=A0A834HEH0_RHOSS|nr:hypothetical protein RHSIM_Rhsim02G0229800 [Rhododendron simsii]